MWVARLQSWVAAWDDANEHVATSQDGYARHRDEALAGAVSKY